MPFSYWPGGIPDYIKADKIPLRDKIDELTTAWELFVEQWIVKPAGTTDQEYEVEQRRDLVSRWAQAPQSLRDQYHERALSSPVSWNGRERKDYVPRGDHRPAYFYVCIAPLDTPRNRALWTKLRILSYDFYYSNEGICNPEVISPSLFSAETAIEPKDLLKTCYLKNANFNAMAMTVYGTVVFGEGGTAQWIFADQRSLEDAMLLAVDIESNGKVMWNMYIGLGKRLCEKRLDAGFDRANADIEEGEFGDPIDMSKPILEILADLKAKPGYDAEIPAAATWVEMIEHNAPGYLELEAEGRGDEYDHSLFANRTG